MTTENVLLVISLLTGILGVPVIQWVKKITGIEDKWALLGATVVSFLLGGAVTFLAGDLAMGDTVTLPAVIEAWGVIMSVATVIYKALVSSKEA